MSGLLQTLALALPHSLARLLFSSMERPVQIIDLARLGLGPFEVAIAELQ